MTGDQKPKKDKDNKNMMLAAGGGLAAGAIGGAVIANAMGMSSSFLPSPSCPALIHPIPSPLPHSPTSAPCPSLRPNPEADQTDDSDNEHHTSSYATAPSAGYGGPSYGAPPGTAPPGVLPPTDADGNSISSSDREDVQEARADYEEALADANDSDASSSDHERLEEAREEYEEEVEEAYDD